MSKCSFHSFMSSPLLAGCSTTLGTPSLQTLMIFFTRKDVYLLITVTTKQRSEKQNHDWHSKCVPCTKMLSRTHTCAHTCTHTCKHTPTPTPPHTACLSMMVLPMGVDPVKPSLRISGCSEKAWPTTDPVADNQSIIYSIHFSIHQPSIKQLMDDNLLYIQSGT